jgi:hydrogenase expression/formation protein HypE
MDEGKLPISELKLILKFKGFENEGIILSGKVGGDTAIIDLEKAEANVKSYYNSNSNTLLVEKSDPITFPTPEPGKYAVIINANDIACSGAKPYGFLSTIIVPPDTSFEKISEIQKQIHEQCLESEISVLGGHTEISNSVNTCIVSGHMLGFVPVDFLVANELRESDKVVVVGFVGTEGIGILLSESGERVNSILSKEEIQNGIKIGRRIDVSNLALDLNRNFKPSLIHDATEGGIYGALTEIVAFSDNGIMLKKKPVLSTILEKLAEWLDFNPYRIISSGALVICIKEEKIKKLSDFLINLDIPFDVIGTVTKDKGIVRLEENILEESKGDEIIIALEKLEGMKIEHRNNIK